MYSEGLQVAGVDQVSPFSGLGSRSVLKTDLPGEAEDHALTEFAGAWTLGGPWAETLEFHLIARAAVLLLPHPCPDVSCIWVCGYKPPPWCL